MRLLFLNSIGRDIYGGMEEWMRLVASGLLARSHSVTIAGRTNSEFLRRIKANHDDLDLLPLEISGDFKPATISRIKREITTRRIDTIIVNFNKDVRLGGLAARLNGEAKVIWSVGLDITSDKLIHRILTPKLIDGVIVPSQSLKQQICRRGYIEPESVEVISIGIPDDNCKPSREAAALRVRRMFELKEESIVCVTSGRFVKQKGHYYLFDAIPEILDSHPDAVFLMLGEGELETQLRKKARELNITDNVVFAGMRDDVSEILPGCDLMIHPSIEEPFGIAILEGMRAGLPVVASRAGGIPEVVVEGETAVLVEPALAPEISSGVIDLLSSPERLHQLGAAGMLRWQTVFSFDVMIDRVEKYLLSHHTQSEKDGIAKTARA